MRRTTETALMTGKIVEAGFGRAGSASYRKEGQTMNHRSILFGAVLVAGWLIGWTSSCSAQTQVLSPSPPNIEYQYQLYYPRWYGWPGPGLSLGGSLPSRGREGISSFYGRPLPVPLGSGVFVNPYAYATQLPGFMSFGLASSTPSKTATPPGTLGNSEAVMQAGGATPPAVFAPNAGSPTMPTNAVLRPISASSPFSIEQSREMESFGDVNLISGQWTQAYINYRNAVLVAGDRADAHAHLGLACLALQKFSEAAQEYKRALTLDPTMGEFPDLVGALYVPESRRTRNDLTRNVAEWAREDLRDQDRLFLLGLVLHDNQDRRAREILEAAFRLTGSGDHIVALMRPLRAAPPVAPREPSAPIPEPPDLPKLPELHSQPLALKSGK